MMLGLPRHGMIIAAGGGLPFAIDGGSIGVMPMRQPQPFAPDRASNGGRMWGRFGRRAPNALYYIMNFREMSLAIKAGPLASEQNAICHNRVTTVLSARPCFGQVFYPIVQIQWIAGGGLRPIA